MKFVTCLHPILINNPKFGDNVKEPTKIFVPCGKCEVCRDNEAKAWRFRLNEEFNKCNNAVFITLTYNDNSLHYEHLSNSLGQCFKCPTVCKSDIQKFFKRLRKNCERIGYGEKIKYFLVSEYGPNTLRPHYHAVIFNFPTFSPYELHNKYKRIEFLQACWNLGYVDLGNVTPKAINYVTKYVCMQTELPEHLKMHAKPFRLVSKGLGKCFLDKKETIEYLKNNLTSYINLGYVKKTLPRYLKDKIFDDLEKEFIRIKYLNDVEATESELYNRAIVIGTQGNTEKEVILNYLKNKVSNYLENYSKNNIKKRKDL